MQSNTGFERTTRPAHKAARQPVEFKDRRKAETYDGKTWTRNDQKRRQSDMMQ